MASTLDSSQQLNHVEDQENVTVSSNEPPSNISDEKVEEQIPSSEFEQTDINTIDGIEETDMVTAEASFTEATLADLPPGATRSSVARILVKPGQIFRVQVDNEVKEVHGKVIYFNSIERLNDKYQRKEL
jgi:hypothetical protein